jgi:predicted transposase/invertase (TIGR01784 family)
MNSYIYGYARVSTQQQDLIRQLDMLQDYNCTEILTGFLNAILEESLDAPIASLQLEDPHLHKSYEDDKLSILDLLATLDNGTQVNIEIQLRNTHDMVKRSLYLLNSLFFISPFICERKSPLAYT